MDALLMRTETVADEVNMSANKWFFKMHCVSPVYPR
jgi:hypothetical protein